MSKTAYICENTLFGDFGAYPRPTRYDKNILQRTAEKIATAIEQWLIAEDIFLFKEDLDKEYETLVKFLKKNLAQVDDGYDLAKRLEDKFYYDSDSHLVGILDDGFSVWLYEYKKAVKIWVKETGLKPTLKIGDKAAFIRRKYLADKGERVEGEISSIDEKSGMYVIHCPQLGHVQKGQVGSHGLCVNFEDTEVIE